MRTGKLLGLSAAILLLFQNFAWADPISDLTRIVQSYAGNRAYFYMLMTPFEENKDYGDWGRGNLGTLHKLIDGGYLNKYNALSRDCQDGLNALRPACARERGIFRFAFTEKALPFFGATKLGQINVPGLRNARMVIGMVKSYTVTSIKPSVSKDCDFDVVARKELSEKNEIGNLILAGTAFEEGLCFVKKDDGSFKLKRFYPIY